MKPIIKKLNFSFIEEKLQKELIPQSRIKSPGELLKVVKTESSYNTPRGTGSYNTPRGTGTGTPRATPRSDSMLSTPRGDCSGVDIDGLRPLKASSADTEPCFTLSLAFQKILTRNNVSLRSTLNHKQTVAAVASIIEELNDLPYTFVKKLNIKIVLTDRSDAEKYWLNSKDVQSQEKIVGKLYMQIFQGLLKHYPDIVRLWNPDIQRYSTQTSEGSEKKEKIEQIERAFYALMLNKQYPKSKMDVTNLKELLVRFDSVGFCGEWFKSRNRNLKRAYKVRFDNPNEKNIFADCKRTLNTHPGYDL